MDYRQRYAILNANKRKWLVLKQIPDTSGIYILTRYENGFKYCYVGQSLHLLTRLAEHLMGYQHIDLSLKKHGLLSGANPNGWGVDYIECESAKLDELEMQYITKYANEYHFQMLNKTSGSQGNGKFALETQRERKGYMQGVEHGYEKARKEIKQLFDKYLKAEMIKENKISMRMLEKFKEFVNLS